MAKLTYLSMRYSPEIEIPNKNNAMPQVFSFCIIGLGACMASNTSVRGIARCLHGASHLFKPFEQHVGFWVF